MRGHSGHPDAGGVVAAAVEPEPDAQPDRATDIGGHARCFARADRSPDGSTDIDADDERRGVRIAFRIPSPVARRNARCQPCPDACP